MPREAIGLVGQFTLIERLRALWGANPAANFLFVTAIVIGFFHGWLKLHYRNVFMTFAFDAPLTLALALALFRLGGVTPWFPKNQVAGALKMMCGVSFLYAVIPFGVPLLASLAAFRAWVIIPLIFLLGYHATRSIRQLELVLLLVIGLCVVTVVYGLRQSPEEIRAMIEANPEIAMRLQGTFFGSSTGEAHLRTFSTFVSAGAFGATMAFGGLFTFAFATQPGRKAWVRLVLFAVLGLCAWGINLSGARTAIAILGMGILVISWSRRRLLLFVALPALAAAFAGGVGVVVDPARLERFAALMDPVTVWGRFYIVIAPGIEFLIDHPLGGGLGRSGHGVPFILGRFVSPWEVRSTDGDFGRIMADYGLAGLVGFGILFGAGVVAAVRWMKKFRDTPLQTLSLCAGNMFIIAVINVGTGSPFLAIPTGALVWFLMGSMSRLADIHAELLRRSPETVWADPRMVPWGQEPRLPEGISTRPMPVDAAAESRPKKHRFLYHRETPAEDTAEKPAPQGRPRGLAPLYPRPRKKQP